MDGRGSRTRTRGGACPCRRTSFKSFDFVAKNRPESESGERPERHAGKGERQISRPEGCALGARREREKANPPGSGGNGVGVELCFAVLRFAIRITKYSTFKLLLSF